MKKQFIFNPAGFTLIELIIVIALIGIISVVVFPLWNTTSMNFQYEVRQVADDIRYAQALSLASGQRYRFERLSATAYQITNEAGTALILPSGSNQVTLTSASFTGFTNLPNNLIAFNSLGAPYTTSAYPGTALASTASITLSGGSVTSTIQITPETGAVNLL